MLKLDIEDIKKRYQEYNKEYFYGKLGKCEFHFFTKNMTYAGAYNYKVKSNGKVVNQIWLGRGIKWTEESLKPLLIHEMIHMYNRTIESDRCDGILGHGRRFKRQCRRLMKEHGLKISIHGGYEYIDERPKPALWEKVLLWVIDR